MHPFKLVERDLSPAAREIRVEGELDLAVAPRLGEAISRSAVDLVVIDLERCEFIDSSGIAVILQAQGRSTENARRVVVHGAAGQVLRILTVSGLAENGLVFGDLDQALASVEGARG